MIKYKNNKRKAQATLEATLAYVAIFTFLLAATQFFIWANTQLVKRQRQYEFTRFALGMSTGTGIIPNVTPFLPIPDPIADYKPDKLNIFGAEGADRAFLTPGAPAKEKIDIDSVADNARD